MGAIRILDGGMGRQLAKIGAPFRMPEWSALALIEAPDFVAVAEAAGFTVTCETLAAIRRPDVLHYAYVLQPTVRPD